MNKYLYGHVWKWGFWLRLFGYGISVSNDRPLFSERYGFERKYFRIFGVKFEYLSKQRIEADSNE